MSDDRDRAIATATVTSEETPYGVRINRGGMTKRIVVIGADAAGMSAASQAKRIAGDAVEIVAFERGAYTSFSACGIPYWVAGDVDGPERLVARSADAHRSNGIDLRMR